MHTDFNLHCLPGMDFCDDDLAASRLLEMLSRCEIKRAILTPAFDHTRDDVRSFLHRRDAILKRVRTLRHPGVELQRAAVISCSSGVSETPGIARLAVEGSDHICVSLPLGMNGEIIDAELHGIMHKHRLVPIFMDFDVHAILYDAGQLYKIMNTPYASFQFNIASLTKKPVVDCIKLLLKNKKRVLFGSGIKNYARPLSYNLPVRQFERLHNAQSFHYYVLKCDRFLRP